MITKLIIQNFKGFGSTSQTIEFAPITFLFGANSAGKSSIFHALFFLRELICTGVGTPGPLCYFSDRVELGGFSNTIHQKDIDRDIHLTLCLDTEETIGNDYSLGSTELRLQVTVGRIDQYRGHVKCFKLFESNNLLFQCEGKWNDKHRFFDVALSFGFDALQSYVYIDPPEDTLTPWTTFYNPPGVMPRISDPMLSIGCRRAKKSLTDDEIRFTKDVDELLIAVLQFATSKIDEILYIGPVRQIPPADYSAQTNPPRSRWASGLAAWDQLHFCTDDQLATMNEILEHSGEVGLDARIQVFREILIPIPSDPAFIQVVEPFYRIRIVPLETSVEHSKNPVKLRVQDVGFGISQLIPIVVAFCMANERLVMIEQPEIHLHPRLQTALGDLLITACLEDSQTFKNSEIHPKRCFIETHSEHLLLRVLRRIRETANGKDFGILPKVSYHDVMINYIDVTQGQTVVTQLRINEQGEFIDRWPHGFFDERMDELF